MESKESISADQNPREDASKEELERRLKEVTEQLEMTQQRYVDATQGGPASASATPAGYRALTADLMSRLKEKRGAADSEYEPQERELRDLRNAIDKLQKERDALIQEIKAQSLTNDSR
jgi:polyhydroxyalkanoate synthesis regulator phasin